MIVCMTTFDEMTRDWVNYKNKRKKSWRRRKRSVWYWHISYFMSIFGFDESIRFMNFEKFNDKNWRANWIATYAYHCHPFSASVAAPQMKERRWMEPFKIEFSVEKLSYCQKMCAVRVIHLLFRFIIIVIVMILKVWENVHQTYDSNIDRFGQLFLHKRTEWWLKKNVGCCQIVFKATLCVESSLHIWYPN